MSAEQQQPQQPIKKDRARKRTRHELITERLLKDEVVVKQAVISDGIYWRAAGVFILAVFVALIFPGIVELGALLAIVSVLMAVYAIILKEVLLIVITNKRILVRYGILQVDVVDIHFDKVESVELRRMITGYLFGYATVVIMGTGNRFMFIPYVANAIEIRRAFNEQTLNHPAEALPAQPVVIVGDQT